MSYSRDKLREEHYIDAWGVDHDKDDYFKWAAQMAIERINILDSETNYCSTDEKTWVTYIVEWQDLDGKWHKLPYTTEGNETEALYRVVNAVRAVRRGWGLLAGRTEE